MARAAYGLRHTRGEGPPAVGGLGTAGMPPNRVHHRWMNQHQRGMGRDDR